MDGFLNTEPVMQYSDELHFKIIKLGLIDPKIDWNLSEHPYTSIVARELTSGLLVRAIVKVENTRHLNDPRLHEVVIERLKYSLRKQRFFSYPADGTLVSDEFYHERPPTAEELRRG